MINKNCLVRFKNRCQQENWPMRVTDVRYSRGVRMCKIDGLWWNEQSLITDKEWATKEAPKP